MVNEVEYRRTLNIGEKTSKTEYWVFGSNQKVTSSIFARKKADSRKNIRKKVSLQNKAEQSVQKNSVAQK